MSKETGGPAFPAAYTGNHGLPYRAEGMTLRDYFAAKAMQGLLSNPSIIDGMTESTIKWIAKNAMDQADAMLAESNKEQP